MNKEFKHGLGENVDKNRDIQFLEHEPAFTSEGLLIRKFNKKDESAARLTEPELNHESEPIMFKLVQVYKKLGHKDPEKDAFDQLFGRLEPGLTESEKIDKMRRIVEEYNQFVQSIDNTTK